MIIQQHNNIIAREKQLMMSKKLVRFLATRLDRAWEQGFSADMIDAWAGYAGQLQFYYNLYHVLFPLFPSIEHGAAT